IRSTRGKASNRSAGALILASPAATGLWRSGFRGPDEQTQSVAVLADQQGASIELDQEQGGTWRQPQRFHYHQPAPGGPRPCAVQLRKPADSDRSDYHY